MLGGFQATHVALFRPLCGQLQRGSARRKVMTSSSPFNQVVSVFVPDEGTRSLLMRLHESELAMVEKDKAMVEKDKAMVEKEVKHVQVEIELRLTIAEREKQLELGAMQTRLEDAKTELAKEKGLLNCRGMIELIEEEMRKVCLGKSVKYNGRLDLWEKCLGMKEFKPLLDCLSKVTGSQARTPKALGQAVASFYSELSLSVHGHNSKEEWIASKDILDIDAANLSKPRTRMLVCMAQFLMIKYSTNVTASSDDGEVGGDEDEIESDEYTGENEDD
jgi:hypothetical protein